MSKPASWIAKESGLPARQQEEEGSEEGMRLTIRATDVRVLPSDTSGFLVEIECADAEAVRDAVLRGPDDGADDWPLAKRYGEVCDQVIALEEELASVKREESARG